MDKHKTRRNLTAACLTLMLLAVPAMAGDKSDLEGRIVTYAAAFNEGDAATLGEMYTTDAKRMPYQDTTITGRQAIEAQVHAMRDAGFVKLELGVTEAESQGNMAWGTGTYKLIDGDGNVSQQGKWMNVSVKIDGTWLIHRDIWNTDAP